MKHLTEIFTHVDAGVFHFLERGSANILVDFVRGSDLEGFSTAVIASSEITNSSELCLALSREFGFSPFTRWGGVVDSIRDLSHSRAGLALLWIYEDDNLSEIDLTVIEMLSYCCAPWIKAGKPFHVVFCI